MITTNSPADRFLQRRGDRWHYVRRVPARVAGEDPRGPRIRISLRTDDLAVARAMRDALEKAVLDGSLNHYGRERDAGTGVLSSMQNHRLTSHHKISDTGSTAFHRLVSP